MDTQQHGDTTDSQREVIVAMSRDLFFGMRVRTVVRKLGFNLTLTQDEATVLKGIADDSPILAIIDFNQPVNWDTLQPLLDGDVPVIGFGSHTDVDGFRAAKAAGVSRVVSNGEFSRRLGELIEQYRRR